MKPLAIDLFCGLGGWSEGLLAEGYDVVGFDIERHRYPARALPESEPIKARGVVLNDPSRKGEDSYGRSFNWTNECRLKAAPLTGHWMEYPGQLVVQDVLTLHGSQFKDAALIVASPPCQEYSYMAMPWKRGRAKAAAIRADTTGRMLADLNRLFDACFRIQMEASVAAGRHVPMVVENVRGAIPWVGRSRWNFGSFHLWGDVPALMPWTLSAKIPGFRFDGSGRSFQTAAVKTVGHPNIRDGHAHTRHLTNPAEHERGIKQPGINLSQIGFNVANAREFGDLIDTSAYRRTEDDKRQHIGGARKAASAMIAKIPLPLARHIAAVYKPQAARI